MAMVQDDIGSTMRPQQVANCLNLYQVGPRCFSVPVRKLSSSGRGVEGSYAFRYLSPIEWLVLHAKHAFDVKLMSGNSWPST
jgi:hypothetical protein